MGMRPKLRYQVESALIFLNNFLMLIGIVMQFIKETFSRFSLMLASVLLISCGGGETDSKSEESSSPIELFISGPSEVLSSELINYSISSNKTGLQFYCEWTYDGAIFYSNEVNGECNHKPRNITEDTVVTLYISGTFEGEKFQRQVPIEINYHFRLIDHKQLISDAVVIGQNQMLNLATASLSLVNSTSMQESGMIHNCESEGTYQIEIVDVDESQSLSKSDTVTYIFDNCDKRSMTAKVSGQLDLVIDGISASGKVTHGQIKFSDLQIESDKEVSITGSLQIEQLSTEHRVVLSLASEKIEFNSPPSSSYSIGNRITFGSINGEKIEDYLQATIDIDFNYDAEIEYYAGVGNFLVAYEKPVKSYFGSYPHSGEITILNQLDESEVIILKSVENPNSENHFQWPGEDSSRTFELSLASWSGLSTFQLSDLEFMSIGPSYVEKIRVVGKLLEKPKFEVEDELTIVFNRPIASIEEEVEMVADWFFGHITTVDYEILGAKVKVVPKEVLKAGVKYSVFFPQVVSNDGLIEKAIRTDIKVSDSIIPVISLSQEYFDGTTTLEATADKSVLNEGREFQYFWRVKEEIEVEFSQPEQIETLVTPFSNITHDFTLQLAMSNELQESSMVEKTIRFLDTSDSYILVIGKEDSIVSEGETWPLNSRDGVFKYSTSPYEGIDNNKSFVSVGFEGNATWTLEVEAPSGEVLQPKVYEGATRYPFQEDSVAGLSFRGNGSGCNNSFSDFEIHEIVWDQNLNLVTLAMDFKFVCEQITRNPVLGFVRINSNLPLHIDSEFSSLLWH